MELLASSPVLLAKALLTSQWTKTIRKKDAPRRLRDLVMLARDLLKELKDLPKDF